MLIRFVINNITSFGEEREFNMLPAQRLRTFKHHKYSIKDFNLLKMASIYGANGSGKSNLVLGLKLLKDIVTEQERISALSKLRFKFNQSIDPQHLVVEFFQDEIPFLYGIEVKNGVVLTEELYRSGLGKVEDQLIFERKTDPDTLKTTLKSELLEQDAESQVLKRVIEQNLSKADQPVMKLLTTLNHLKLEIIATALNWFYETLEIVTPKAKPKMLTHLLDVDHSFNQYTNEMIYRLGVGIDRIGVEKRTLKEHFWENNSDQIDEFIQKFEELGKDLMSVVKNNKELIISKENNQYYVKEFYLEHSGKDDQKARFTIEEESDGTARLLDLIPAFRDITTNEKVYIIDEIERSIHPLLIKELIRKFSEDQRSNGQLIFTTHESNLLDQKIFRQDEVWFTEKDQNGVTDLYSLSSFKEHNTLDIRKGYLAGRYGSIPFLANFKDLNWHQYDSEK